MREKTREIIMRNILSNVSAIEDFDQDFCIASICHGLLMLAESEKTKAVLEVAASKLYMIATTDE